MATQVHRPERETRPGASGESTAHDERVAAYRRAVVAELEELDVTPRPRVRLENAKRVTSSSSVALWRFDNVDARESRLDAPATLQSGAQRVSVDIVRATPAVIEVGIPAGADLSETSATLEQDERQILRRTIERLGEMRTRRNPVGDSIVDGTGVRGSRLDVRVPGLNAAQQDAVGLALGVSPAYVWGPPGTGKTHTIGAIVAEAVRRGKRCLVASHTNIAVDQALLRVADRVGDAGVVRFGVPHDRRLAERDDLIFQRLRETRLKGTLLRLRELRKERKAASAERTRLETEAASRRTRGRYFLAGEAPPDLAADEARDSRIVALARQLVALADEEAELEAKCSSVTHQILSSAAVVGCTLTSAAINADVDALDFDAVVVDEASIAGLPLAWLAGRHAEHAVVVGDFRQLAPISQAASSADPHRAEAVRGVLDVSPFESSGITNAVEAGTLPANLAVLDTQHRMHPAISRLVNGPAYGGLLHDAPTVDDDSERDDWIRDDWDRDAPHVIVRVPAKQGRSLQPERGSRSSVNPFSAMVSIATAARMLRPDRPDADPDRPRILILTPFRAQRSLLQAMLREAGLDRDVRPATVHASQGAEASVVILDVVARADSTNRVVKDDSDDQRRWMTVAVTRARRQLVVVGDAKAIAARHPRGVLGRTFRSLTATELMGGTMLATCGLAQASKWTKDALTSQLGDSTITGALVAATATEMSGHDRERMGAAMPADAGPLTVVACDAGHKPPGDCAITSKAVTMTLGPIHLGGGYATTWTSPAVVKSISAATWVADQMPLSRVGHGTGRRGRRRS
jgi:hypothetical protein